MLSFTFAICGAVGGMAILAILLASRVINPPISSDNGVKTLFLVVGFIFLIIGATIGYNIEKSDPYGDKAYDSKHTTNNTMTVTEEEINDLGYYKKNGKWYYQGQGVNDSNGKTLGEIMNEMAGE